MWRLEGTKKSVPVLEKVAIIADEDSMMDIVKSSTTDTQNLQKVIPRVKILGMNESKYRGIRGPEGNEIPKEHLLQICAVRNNGIVIREMVSRTDPLKLLYNLGTLNA